MSVYVRCSACGGEHLSPVQFGGREGLDRAEFSGNQMQCPVTGKAIPMEKKDLFWRDSESASN